MLNRWKRVQWIWVLWKRCRRMEERPCLVAHNNMAIDNEDCAHAKNHMAMNSRCDCIRTPIVTWINHPEQFKRFEKQCTPSELHFARRTDATFAWFVINLHHPRFQPFSDSFSVFMCSLCFPSVSVSVLYCYVPRSLLSQTVVLLALVCIFSHWSYSVAALFAKRWCSFKWYYFPYNVLNKEDFENDLRHKTRHTQNTACTKNTLFE